MQATANDAVVSTRRSTGRHRRLVGALSFGVLVVGALLLVPAAIASAQTVPTVPCPDCGPGPNGDGTHVWSFTEFVCEPQRGFIVQFGVGRFVDEPVNFSAGSG